MHSRAPSHAKRAVFRLKGILYMQKSARKWEGASCPLRPPFPTSKHSQVIFFQLESAFVYTAIREGVSAEEKALCYIIDDICKANFT